MKKLIRYLMTLVVLLPTIALANEVVTIVYAFGAADSIANYHRSLVAEANRIQSKYTFVFDTKPGAGNTVAANYVKNTPNTILATSSAFFIRPVIYPSESYNVVEFRSLMPQCDAPMAVVSSRYKSWQEVPKDKKLSIGVTGLGATSHLIALQITEQYKNILIVPFKHSGEIMIALANNTIDLGVGFISEAENLSTNTRPLNILGTTGDRQIKQYPLLYKQGLPKVLSNLNNPQHLIVPKTVSDQKFQEWRSIMVQAGRSDSVRSFYKSDSCIPLSDMPDSEISTWFNSSNERWKKIASTVDLTK